MSFPAPSAGAATGGFSFGAAAPPAAPAAAGAAQAPPAPAATGGFGFGGAAPAAAPAGGAAKAPVAGDFGFGATPAAPAAPATTGGFGFGATAPPAAATTAPAPAATGFFLGGAPAAPAAAPAAKAPAATTGFSFGGATPAAAAPPASATDAAKAPAAAAAPAVGFGFATTAPAAAAGTSVTTTTTTTTATAVSAPSAALSAGTGFPAAPAAAATTAATAAATTTTAAASQSASQELATKTLGAVIGKLDKTFAEDVSDFMELMRHVQVRDRQLAERATSLALTSFSIKAAVAANKATTATLDECEQKQEAVAKLIEELEDAVDPAYERALTVLAKPNSNGSNNAALSADDRTRIAAYDTTLALFDEVQALQQRLDGAVRQHRRARRGVGSSGSPIAAAAVGSVSGRVSASMALAVERQMNCASSELDGMIALTVSQLSALESCGVLAESLEKELNTLIGL